jgi:high affinity Mn2+ porin
MRLIAGPCARTAGLAAAVCLLAGLAGAQPPATEPAGPDTLFPHPAGTRWWLSGQINLIEQGHGDFTSPYEGPNSLRPVGERALSRVWTIFTGCRVTKWMDVIVDVEAAGGKGVSDALGLAGFSNLDVVRNPTLGSTPYLARGMVHVTVPLTADRERADAGPMSLANERPTRRLEIRLGKMSLADQFDLNAAGSDSHLQFLNWAIDNTGAYDYAADTRGYTVAAVVEYDVPRWSLRGAEALMPTVANGIHLDGDLGRARAENVELELRPNDHLTARVLVYVNHANMGDYQEAISAFQAGIDPRPDIEAHRQQGRIKQGVAGNVEYRRADVRLFARSGWNEGRYESFAYTEVNDTIVAGGDLTGRSWSRARDRAGVALVSNGLSSLHRQYLGLGGLGFLLGDGALRYGRETILESYYTARLWRGVFASGDLQYVTRPGYNRDRGPVAIGAVRLHVDF